VGRRREKEKGRRRRIREKREGRATSIPPAASGAGEGFAHWLSLLLSPLSLLTPHSSLLTPHSLRQHPTAQILPIKSHILFRHPEMGEVALGPRPAGMGILPIHSGEA
jgi:hypothetical protein